MSSSWNKAVRLFHTLRPLRPVQITNRITRRLGRPKPHIFAPAPARPAPQNWQPVPSKPTCQRAEGVFEFLNAAHDLDQVGWDSPTISKLWRYNLHYHDALLQRAPVDPAGLIQRWISENPAPLGSGWEPYPTALRLVNWVKYWAEGGLLDEPARASLAQQTDWLMQRLEWHLLGNHLFANGKALVFASVLLADPLRSRALTRGVAILTRELPEQFLPDGGHFERSPMYHALGLEDLLDLHNLLQAVDLPQTRDIARSVAAHIPRALHWTACMTHPDGRIGLFNDAAFGIAHEFAALQAYATRLGFAESTPDPGPLTHLAPSGYVRLSAGPTTALLDCAPLGPSYLPAHAHADTLSFEMSLGRHRVIVNGGTSVYGTGQDRAAQRATAAHATVEVDGRNSSDVWAGFRVGRQAQPGPVEITEPGMVACSHNGYHPCRHHRCWSLDPARLKVTDWLTGPFRTARAFFPLHPDWSVTMEGPAEMRLHHASGAVPDLQVLVTGAADIHIDATAWHPRFGVALPAKRLVLTFEGDRLQSEWIWGTGIG